MKSYGEYLSLLVQGADADLAERDCALLAGAMLDGGVPDIELGALLGAFKATSGGASLLRGLLQALDTRVTRWSTSQLPYCPVSLACYGGTSHTANLTPLLGLMLARFGIPVLVHGPLNTGRGVSVALVLRELGVLPCVSKEAVAQALQNKSLAFVPDALLAPGLARLLSFRARLGAVPLLVDAARLIDPFDTGTLIVAAGDSAQTLDRLRSVIAVCGLRSLLLQGPQGEPFANPDVRPRMEYWCLGASTVLFDEDACRPVPRRVALPMAADVEAVASWIRQALDGTRAIPSPLVNQLAACLFATGYCEDFNQAKALAAIASVGRRVA